MFTFLILRYDSSLDHVCLGTKNTPLGLVMDFVLVHKIKFCRHKHDWKVFCSLLLKKPRLAGQSQKRLGVSNSRLLLGDPAVRPPQPPPAEKVSLYA